MRNRLTITVALGLAAAVAATGAVSAQSSKVLEVGGTEISIDLPGGGQLPNLDDALPACANLTDDDGDAAVDLEDPGCEGPLDPDEADPAPAPGEPKPADPPNNLPGPDQTGKGGGAKVPGNAPGSGDPFGLDPATDGVGDAEPEEDDREPLPDLPGRNADGSPTAENPTITIATFGPAPIGVPNVVIDYFAIPPFLLPIYQACGTQYGIPWQVLASINRIETAFGTNLNVSSAGALGWMQFMPATWKAYGVDANGDGRKDPYNPVDAICAAARYLNASGGEADLETAIFAYNHADWYVDEVLLYAREYGSLPSWADRLADRPDRGRPLPRRRQGPLRRRHLRARGGKRSQHPDDGVTGNVAERDQRLPDPPRHRHLRQGRGPGRRRQRRRDQARSARTSGSATSSSWPTPTATSSPTPSSARSPTRSPVPKERKLTAKDFELVAPAARRRATASLQHAASTETRAPPSPRPTNTEDARDAPLRPPERPANRERADLTGQLDDILGEGVPGYETFKAYFTGVLRFDPKTMEQKPLEEGSKVIAGTVIGRIGEGTDDRRLAPQLRDRAGRPRLPQDRPEADPRRLEAARGDRDLPRRRQEPVPRPRQRRPDPADEQGAADPAASSATRGSRSTPAAARTSAPVRSTAGSSPPSSTSPSAASARP